MGKFGWNNSGIDLYEKNIIRLKTRWHAQEIIRKGFTFG